MSLAPTEMSSALVGQFIDLFLFIYRGVTYLSGRDGFNAIDLVVWRADVGMSRQ